MRIIAGEFRSRVLVAPEGSATRPTMDRARESLFNVLSNVMDLEGISVLDLYAGSGALAFEAMSRGAKNATLVDRNPKAVEAIRKNAQALGVMDAVTIVRQEVHRFLKFAPQKPFELILMDPPYEEKQIVEVGDTIFREQWLAPDGFCAIEQRSNTRLPPIENAAVTRELKAGEARFTLLIHATPL